MDPDNDLKFSLLDTFRDPLSRQILEAVRIKTVIQSGIFINKSDKKT